MSDRGPIAPDGCPIAVYLAIPGDDEAAVVHAVIPAAAPILELGCGVGRMTRPLVALGHVVTGVDNSDAMLAHASRLAGVETVNADIATLDLAPRTWPVVMLASRLVNDERGAEYLAAASRHVTARGMVVVERHDPGWIDSVQPMGRERPGISSRLVDVDHGVAGVLRATMIYEVDGCTYRQPFVAYEVDDDRLATMAAAAGLHIDRVVDDARTWVVLRPS